MDTKLHRQTELETLPYIYPGRPGSYDYTKPERYRRKDERPGTTGLYKKDSNYKPFGTHVT